LPRYRLVRQDPAALVPFAHRFAAIATITVAMVRAIA
jgi:hypothetical protein